MALDKATIYILRSTSPPIEESIDVQFNPEEYSLDLGNSFAEIGIPGLPASPIQYVRGNLPSLRMELFCDTYEQRRDVREETRKITNLLNKDPQTQAPPILLFVWGSLNFKCVLESVGQRFTMFDNNGKPVRATLTVVFKQYEPVEIEIEQISTEPGFAIPPPPQLRTLLEGDSLTQIAGEVLGDPGAWREIAELNNIDDPFNLVPGQSLVLPSPPTPPRLPGQPPVSPRDWRDVIERGRAISETWPENEEEWQALAEQGLTMLSSELSNTWSEYLP